MSYDSIEMLSFFSVSSSESLIFSAREYVLTYVNNSIYSDLSCIYKHNYINFHEGYLNVDLAFSKWFA